jgi:hypothetical protein
MLEGKKLEMRKDLDHNMLVYQQQVVDTRTEFKDNGVCVCVCVCVCMCVCVCVCV